ncbi:MAG: hypothetical protein SGILL_009364 [Bacillariaceae sp.]
MLKEAEELFEAFPEADSFFPAGMFANEPSPIKQDAYGILMVARVTLAEAFEENAMHEKALPLYLKLVDQTEQMRSEVRAIPDQKVHMMNNVALCYKRQDMYDDAIAWYRKGLEDCEQQNLVGSPIHKILSENLQTMIGMETGALDRGSTSVRACWNCKKREMVGEDGTSTRKLLNCTKCREMKVATPACYCSKECQIIDWKNRHQEFHRTLNKQRKNWKDANFTVTDGVPVQVALEGSELNDSDSLIQQALQFMQQHDFKSAERSLKRAIKLNPNDCGLAHDHLGTVYTNCGNYHDAINHFLKGIDLVEGKSDTQSKECWSHCVAGVFGLLTRRPECAGLEKPDWMTNPGKLKGMACEVVKVHPQYPESWFMRGKVYQDAGKRRDAMQCYEKAASLSPTMGTKNMYQDWKQKALKSGRK